MGIFLQVLKYATLIVPVGQGIAKVVRNVKARRAARSDAAKAAADAAILRAAQETAKAGETAVRAIPRKPR